MGKCSISPRLLCVSIDVREAKYRLGHDFSFSVGDGCGGTSAQSHGIVLAQMRHVDSYRKIDTAVIDHCSQTRKRQSYVPQRRISTTRRPAGRGNCLTAHLVLARILAPPAADAQRRRGLGSHRVDALEARMRNVCCGRRSGSHILVLWADDAGPACEWVADRHGECGGVKRSEAPGHQLAR